MIPLCKTLGAAVLVVTATGCGASGAPGTDGPPDGVGCVGVCSSFDAGSGADSGTNAGTSDAGPSAPTVMTIAEARRARYGTWIQLEGVVVNAVDEVSGGDGGQARRSRFWVVEPSRPTDGLWVSMKEGDLPADFLPQVGQRLTLSGWLQSDPDEPFVAHRQHLASLARPLEIILSGSVTPPGDTTAPAGFGDADGGFARPNPELAGTRVYVPGPLVLTNPTPRAFQRQSADPQDAVFYGFEVTGGILVSNQKTSGESPTDGGPARCDWQALVRDDGGTVTFPQGLRGVWDTYSFAPCEDGGTELLDCVRLEGRVPGTEQDDGGYNRYTYVLHPQDCEGDLAGEWDAGGAAPFSPAPGTALHYAAEIEGKLAPTSRLPHD